MVLHVHKELADDMDVIEVAYSFFGDNHQRKQVFVKFTNTDLPVELKLTSKGTQTTQ